MLLTLGAVVGALCLVLTAIAAGFGLRPLVFQSGSMAPAIETGALAFSHKVDAADLETGQVVSVPTETGERITHRIVSVDLAGDTATLELKGDANEVTDPTTYQVTEADVVLFDVPLLGYAVGWLVGPAGLFLLGLYAALLLSIAVRRPPTSTPEQRVAVAAVLLVIVGTGAWAHASSLRVTPTMAAFTDPAGLSGTSVTAGSVGATTLSCSRLQSPNRTQLSWTAVANVTGYSIFFSSGTSPVQVAAGTTSYIDTSPAVGKVIYVVANRAFTSVTWSSVNSNTVTESNGNGTCA